LGLWDHSWCARRKTSSARISLILREFPAHFPLPPKKTSSSRLHTESRSHRAAAMQLEFHQLDRRWEHLRVRHPQRQRRLLASLAEVGQQTPIVVVAAAGESDRYLVIDGYKRIAALQQLGRDTVEAVVWPMSDAEALLLDRSLRLSEQETALEQGWLLQELEQRFGYGLEELARRFDRSVSWVSRRLALVELLPEAIQQQVREGKISAHIAMKFLVPVARINLEDCGRMAAVFAQHHCESREAGQLYAAWRNVSAAIRKRILDAPDLFFKTQRQAEPKAPAAAGIAELVRDLEMVVAVVNRAHRRLAGAAVTEIDAAQREAVLRQTEQARHQLGRLADRIEKERGVNVEPSATDHDPRTAHKGSRQTGDCTSAGNLPSDRAQGTAVEGNRSPGSAPVREGRTVPGSHSGTLQQLQGESRASP
jgi:ParB family transcriptional regulator, chromosome partitioning protein